MDLHLTNKVAVVTGASKGIGLAVTRALVAEGANVVAGARSITDELVALSDTGQVLAVAIDLSDAELSARRAAWGGPRPTIYTSGALWKYAKLVGPTRLGAVTHPGAEAESHVYADL